MLIDWQLPQRQTSRRSSSRSSSINRSVMLMPISDQSLWRYMGRLHIRICTNVAYYNFKFSHRIPGSQVIMVKTLTKSNKYVGWECWLAALRAALWWVTVNMLMGQMLQYIVLSAALRGGARGAAAPGPAVLGACNWCEWKMFMCCI